MKGGERKKEKGKQAVLRWWASKVSKTSIKEDNMD